MKPVLMITFIFAVALNICGQKASPVTIGKADLQMKNLPLGDSTYIIYLKKKPDGPAEKITLVRINVNSTTVDGRKVFAITQQ